MPMYKKHCYNHNIDSFFGVYDGFSTEDLNHVFLFIKVDRYYIGIHVV